MGRLLAVVRPVVVVALVAGAQTGVVAHAQGTGTLAGTVFFDADADGVQGTTEQPLDGDEQVQVGVCADHATLPPPEGHRCTWADGAWSLTGLAPGTWTVTVREGSYQGWSQTTADHVVPVTADATTRVPALGTVAHVGSVAGTVWNDHDGDGVRAAGEPGVPGARVYVNDGAEGGFSATSDAAGRYRVPYVVADRDVLVRIDAVPGDLPPTTPPGGTAQVRVSFAEIVTQDFGVDGEAPPAPPPVTQPVPPPGQPATAPAPGVASVAAAAPGNPRRVRVRGVSTGVRLRWLAPARTGGGPVTGYEVRVARHRNGAGRTVGADAPRLVVTGLQRGHRYWFRVRALNALGPGDWSARRAVRPGG